MKKILVIEDDTDIAELEKDYLNLNGFDVDLEADGIKGLKLALTGAYDLIIVDLMLPGMSGYDIVKAIRNEMEIPLLIVSAKTEDIDKIRGFGSGADDYMTKPFSPSELVARVNTHISRYERLSHQVKKDDKLHLKGLEIHQGSRRVLINGKEVQFTTKEFDLLLFMAKKR